MRLQERLIGQCDNQLLNTRICCPKNNINDQHERHFKKRIKTILVDEYIIFKTHTRVCPKGEFLIRFNVLAKKKKKKMAIISFTPLPPSIQNEVTLLFCH